jgi:hypothetical protein
MTSIDQGRDAADVAVIDIDGRMREIRKIRHAWCTALTWYQPPAELRSTESFDRLGCLRYDRVVSSPAELLSQFLLLDLR